MLLVLSVLPCLPMTLPASVHHEDLVALHAKQRKKCKSERERERKKEKLQE